MIGAVKVSNWKRHRSLEHTFAPGLNFVLGANGHGKTSLLEALRFGLFGAEDMNDVRDAIRFDANATSVQVELSGNEAVSLGRTIDGRGRVSETVSTSRNSDVRALLLSRF